MADVSEQKRIAALGGLVAVVLAVFILAPDDAPISPEPEHYYEHSP